MTLKKAFWASAAVATLCMGSARAQVSPVTDEMLANPPAGDWLTYGRASDNYRHSPLTQITPDNVGSLQLVWARGLEPGPMQGSPLIHEGIMYIPNPGDVIQAVNAVTGDLIWEYRRPVGDTMLLHSLGDRKRGIALYEDKIYFSSWDNHLVALDANSGQVVFDIDRGQGTDLVSSTSGPIIANGVVVLGSSCQYSPFGCFVTGHDAATGEELWRNTFIPRPGEEGDETWGNDYESRWMTGVWGQITYDPVLDLVYYGSSSTGPASEVQRGTPGGAQFGTNTRFAVRPQTGEVVWRHQTLPRDNWDQECTFEMIAADVNFAPSAEMDGLQAIGPNAAGERRAVLGVPCKTGVFWSFDAATGEFIYARDTVVQDIIAGIDETGLVTVNEDKILDEIGVDTPFCPTYLGGRDWPPSSFNPETGTYFITLTNACTISHMAIDQEFTALDVYNVEMVTGLPEGEENGGRIDAINVATGETVWSYEQRNPMYAPLMTTSSGLLFVGGMDRYFRALNQENGEVLWETRLASGATGHPVAFEVDGRQYIAMSGGGANLALGLLGGIVDEAIDGTSVGGAMYVFALPEG